MSTFYDPYDILKVVGAPDENKANFYQPVIHLDHKSLGFQDPRNNLSKDPDFIALTFSHLGDPLDGLYSDYWEGYFKI